MTCRGMGERMGERVGDGMHDNSVMECERG